MKVIFAFAGQGSQFYGMGKPLYESNSTFRETVDKINEIVKAQTRRNVKDTMLGKNNERIDIFDDITMSSLSIFMFEYSAAQMLQTAGVKPDGVIGCSLGEFTAAVCSKVIDIETAIKLIYEQCQLIESEMSKGGMITICDDYNACQKMVEESGCQLVSNNHNRHFVVSGGEASIISLSQKLKQERISFLKLPVNYGFHSDCMKNIKHKYLELGKSIQFGVPCYNFYSCVTTKQETKIDQFYFWRVLSEPIQWRETVSKLNLKDVIFVDLSADAELAAMMNYITSDNQNVFKISTMFNTKLDIESIVNNIKCKGDKKLKAIVFPGQGSQRKGMGADLFDEFLEYVEKADRILGYSIKDLCLNDSEGLLNNTAYTQPALYVVCTLSYLKRIREGETLPDYVAGHSIGEYSALFASGIIDFETGLRLVKKRGELMARANGGKMAAVIGLKEDKVREVLKSNGFSAIDIANLNSPAQIVISGRADDIMAAEKVFTQTDGCIMYKVLNVSAAFHSRYMEIAKEELIESLKSADFHPMKIPVIANVNARPYNENKIVETLSTQLVSSVRWTDSVRYMMAKGVDEFIEVGPGNVVTGLVKRIKREAEPMDLSKEESERAALNIEKEVSGKDSSDNAAIPNVKSKFSALTLGSEEFRKDYNLKYAYAIGSMGYGITSENMIVKAAQSGMLSFFGTSGLSIQRVEDAIKEIQSQLHGDEIYGFNLTFQISTPEREADFIDLYLKYNVQIIEVSSYTTITKQLVRYRVKGLKRNQKGEVIAKNSIFAKVSRPEIAECFMSVPPARIVDALLRDGEITREEADLAQYIPMSTDICVVADSAGYTDRANMFTVFPSIQYTRDRISKNRNFHKKIRIGVAGGIGSPVSAAAAFMMGADFILTGSINQCTAEARTSDLAKDMLSAMNVQDTSYINTLGNYEANQCIQVLKKGTLFYVCAGKLYHLYHEVNSIENIDAKTKEQIETRYLKRSIEEVFEEIERKEGVKKVEDANGSSKMKLKLLFDWYLEQAQIWAIEGNAEYQLNFKIMCSSALGSFNQWVKGTELENWKNRSVTKIGEKLMGETADYLNNFL